MKISLHNRNIVSNKKSSAIKTNSGKNFSSTMDMEKREQQKQKLKKMLEKIKTAGDKLKDAKTLNDIIEYKNYIREYLSFVLDNYYKLKYDDRYRQLLIRVEIINKEVEELTQALLQQQKTNIDIVSKIDEITGLLLDLYS